MENSEPKLEYQHSESGSQDADTRSSSEGNSGHDVVTIFINDHPYTVHQGRLDVSAIRRLDDIPATDVLYELPSYRLLLDDGFVVVHGGECFKSGGSSGRSS